MVAQAKQESFVSVPIHLLTAAKKDSQHCWLRAGLAGSKELVKLGLVVWLRRLGCNENEGGGIERIRRPQAMPFVAFGLRSVLSIGLLEVLVVLRGHRQRQGAEGSSLSQAQLLLNYHSHLQSMLCDSSSFLASGAAAAEGAGGAPKTWWNAVSMATRVLEPHFKVGRQMPLQMVLSQGDVIKVQLAERALIGRQAEVLVYHHAARPGRTNTTLK